MAIKALLDQGTENWVPSFSCSSYRSNTESNVVVVSHSVLNLLELAIITATVVKWAIMKVIGQVVEVLV